MIERQHVSLNAPSACIALLTSCPSRCTRGQPWAESRASSGFAGHLPPIYERTCVCCVCVCCELPKCGVKEGTGRRDVPWRGIVWDRRGTAAQNSSYIDEEKKGGGSDNNRGYVGGPGSWVEKAKELQSVLLESPTPRHLCRRCICSPPSAKPAGCYPQPRSRESSRRLGSKQSRRSSTCVRRG